MHFMLEKNIRSMKGKTKKPDFSIEVNAVFFVHIRKIVAFNYPH